MQKDTFATLADENESSGELFWEKVTLFMTKKLYPGTK